MKGENDLPLYFEYKYIFSEQTKERRDQLCVCVCVLCDACGPRQHLNIHFLFIQSDKILGFNVCCTVNRLTRRGNETTTKE